ncbi:At-Rich Interactive Domain-Containing Protein 4A [Manis pentadactyla]|nr:At-Rich Interactive Domain-Containing Protein 4A [Manis pentadactyla]
MRRNPGRSSTKEAHNRRFYCGCHPHLGRKPARRDGPTPLSASRFTNGFLHLKGFQVLLAMMVVKMLMWKTTTLFQQYPAMPSSTKNTQQHPSIPSSTQHTQWYPAYPVVPSSIQHFQRYPVVPSSTQQYPAVPSSTQ